MQNPPTSAFLPLLPLPLTTLRTTLPTHRSKSTSHRRRTHPHPPRISCKADPNLVLSPTQLEQWVQVSSIIRNIDSSLQSSQADKLVGRAFGWGTQKFWRGQVKEEPPSVDQAQRSIHFLRNSICLDDPAIAAIVKSFPEVLRLSLTRMEQNVQYIQQTYPNIKGNLLKNTVKATPAVLGFDFDCEGDCQSECARCWVQF